MADKKRIGRVSQEILRAVNEVLLKDVRDPRINGVTITEVELTGDLQQATIYYTSLDDSDKAKEEVQEGLEKASGLIRSGVSEHLTTYHSPELLFARDESIESGNRIDELLNQIRQEDQK